MRAATKAVSSPSFKIPALVVLGVMLMQAAWILALPPFRGVDEFDHAYRAAAVAQGQWKPEYVAATHGRGDLLVVPRRLVQAATPVCESLAYTGHDNCNAVAPAGHGDVVVASAAARYNPVFYWLIGTPSKWFEGAHALYAMRIAAAVLCSLFIGLAAWAVAQWSRTRWPLISMLVALTPVAVYSTALPAPNGIEMTAALALWVSLLGLGRPGVSPRTEHQLLVAAIPSAVILATVRSMGPLWVALILLTCLATLGFKEASKLIRRHRRTVGSSIVAVGVAVAAGVWWTRASGTNALEDNLGLSHPLSSSIAQIPLWIFQAIAAFPRRSEPAPAIVYATALVAIVALMFSAFRKAKRNFRMLMVGSAFVALAVPLGLTWATYSQAGAIWQGRYGLCYVFGIFVLAGIALEDSDSAHQLTRPMLSVGCVTMVIAQTVSVTAVLVKESQHSPLSGSSEWLMPDPWVVAVLTIVGGAAWALAACASGDMHARAAKSGDHPQIKAIVSS